MRDQKATDVPLAAVTGGLRLGGSSTFLVNLGCALSEARLRLPIVSLSEPNDHATDFAACDIPVKTIPPCHIYEDRLRLAYDELRRWQPRAVVACLGSESFELLRYAAPGVARLGMIQSHDPGPYRLVRMYAPWLDAMIGVSQKICEEIKRLPEAQGRRVEYIPYGIRFPEYRKRVRENDTTALRLIYVGRLIEEQKRVSRLSELAHELARRKVRFSFTIVGTGPSADALRRATSDLAQVTFAGELPNNEIPDLLQHHDVFVLLSDYEGLPLSLLEAMGAGVVPVVSDLESGMRDVVTEETGFRVPNADIAKAADAIAMLDVDRERLATLASAAAAKARSEYSAQRMAKQFRSLANELGSATPSWPALERQRAPLGLRPPWLYAGLPRTVRRLVKRLAFARPGPSSQP